MHIRVQSKIMDQDELAEWEASSRRRPKLGALILPLSVKTHSGRRSESASHILNLTPMGLCSDRGLPPFNAVHIRQPTLPAACRQPNLLQRILAGLSKENFEPCGDLWIL